MKLIQYILWAPGYIILALSFFIPTEWGKGRNVSKSGRQWKSRNIFAPIYSIAIYSIIWFVYFDNT
jgi:hypothetical protein